ncbi:MAG: cytochrome c3 family protein [Desulfobulbaceae bacterium]|nr:cytochrome c3 family protein [Desulfobulbaceae bacterium]
MTTTFRSISALIFLVLCLFPVTVFSSKIPLPENQGKVVLNNFSKNAGIAPVVFDHWLHRAKFTCRVCHIDVGFAMEEEATGISADLNMQGLYCGACHNGEREIDDTVVFAACAEKFTEKEEARCARCHSRGAEGKREYEFEKFTKNFPRLRGGASIDWEKAEEEGIIKLIDFLPGVSYHRDPLKAQEDFSIEVTTWKSDVIFSHKKHAVWNGCEVCHPQIFPSSEKGTVQYSMFDIMRGEYCGACHLSVSFSVWICYKCHKNPVR